MRGHYTEETRKKLFEDCKLRRQKKKKAKKQQYQREYSKKYWQQEQVLKKSFKEEKKKLMDNLQTLIKQTQERQKEEQIQPSFKFKVYHSDFYIERDTNEEDLYQTIDELKQWEQEHYPCINWNIWQKIVEETKAMLNQST